MNIRSLFKKDVYIRLTGADTFNCTVRYGGFRARSRQFSGTAPIPPQAEEPEEPPLFVLRPGQHLGLWRSNGH
jgi:hypothetical protein